VAETKVISNLAQRLAAKNVAAAHAKAKDAPVDYGFGGGLPAGIEGGVARLSDIKFGEYQQGTNKGELYVILTGIVEHPKTFVDSLGNEHATEGGQTRVGPMPLCASGQGEYAKAFDDNWALFVNELKKLDPDGAGAMDPSQVQQYCDALVEVGPKFKFRTWKIQKRAKTDPKYNAQYDGPEAPEPQTRHTWNGTKGVDQDDSGGDPSEGFADRTEAPTPKTAPKPQPAPAPKAASQPTQPPKGPGTRRAAPPPPPPEPEPVQYTDQGDLESLLELANGGDEAAAGTAMDRLTAFAIEAGKTQHDVDNANSWEQVVGWIRAGESGGGGDGEGAADEGFVPALNGMCQYTIHGKDGKPVVNIRTKKPAPPVTCEVKAVNGKTRKADLLNMDDGKTKYTGVSWDHLGPVD